MRHRVLGIGLLTDRKNLSARMMPGKPIPSGPMRPQAARGDD
jgi:hypothetical protein